MKTTLTLLPALLLAPIGVLLATEENLVQNNHYKQPGSNILNEKSHSALKEGNPLPTARVVWHMNNSNTTGQYPNALKKNGSEEINR